MNRTKIVTLSLAVLVLVALGHHQLVQMSTQALNSPLVTVAQAQTTATPTPTATPTVTPTPTPSPTPGIGQSCTPGFYKKRPGLYTGCTGLSSSTTVGTFFGTGSGISACVAALTLQGALRADDDACGNPSTGNALDQKELQLIKVAITTVLNAANSDPAACTLAALVVTNTDVAISSGIGAVQGETSALLSSFPENDKFGSLCGSGS